MSEVKIIEKEISIIRDKYLRSAIDILSDYNNENKTKLDYKGRQIYELLQNADDCYSDDCADIKVKIELRENFLIIQNTGKPFNSRGIISLMHPDASSKHQGTIGCKGLGFRSILNWANKISICTKSFIANFSEERATSQLQFYKEHCDQDHVHELDSIDRIAILSSAEVNNDSAEIEKWLDDGFSTSIVLHCNSEYVDTIQKQLIELQFEELLFLKHIRNIHIISPKAKRNIEAVSDGERFLIQDGDNFTDWTVWQRTGSIQQKDGTEKAFELIIAYNNDKLVRDKIREEGVLYSYFKTEIPMPFPFLIHGTFELTSERNGLIKESVNNEKLLELLVDFISDKGSEIAANSQQYDYTALEFLLPSQQLYFLDKQYDFTSKLKKKIKGCKLFPTIDDRYISLDELPRYSNKDFARYVSKKTFNSLLKPCKNDTILSYFKELGISFYSSEELVALLNVDADEYVNSGVHDKLIILYHETYSYVNIAPKLLVDSNGKRIADENLTIFNNDENRFTLPEWSEMRFIDLNLEKKLLKSFNCDSRRLMEILKVYGGAEYSFDNVVRQLVSQCREDKQKTKDLLKWLFDNWCNNNYSFKSGLKNINIRLISRDGNIEQSSKCYFGKEYGNDIGERIISCLDTPVFVSGIDELGLTGADMHLVKAFLSQLDVKEYPPIAKKSLTGQDYRKYIEYNSEKYPELSVRNETYRYDYFFYQISREVQVADIIGFENILKYADYRDIIYWMINDNNLNIHIKNINEIDDFSHMWGFPYKKKDTRWVYKDQMLSWLRLKIVETAWLPVKSGKKVNSNRCTITPHSLSPIVEVLNIDYNSISKMFGRPIKKEIDALLEALGVADDIVDLPNETIYEILLTLPDFDKDCTLGKTIYTKLNLHFDKESTARLIKNNLTYQKFLREGKVLAELDGKYKYIPINEVYYVGKKIYSDDILKNYPVLALNRRAGDDKIKSLFGVQSIKAIGSIKVTPIFHHLNDEFQLEYHKLLPYIYARRLDVDTKNKELNLLKSSKIFLVNDAYTEHYVNGELKKGKLRDYELIYTDKTAYIMVPQFINTLTELKRQLKFKNAAAEVITTILDVDRDKDAYLLIFGSTISEIEMYFQTNDETSLVNIAKEKFSNTIDLRHEFWLAIANALSESVDLIENQYAHLLPQEFDYHKINDSSNGKYIIDLFIALNIDVDAYNESAFEQLTLQNYYKEKWIELKNSYRSKYLCYKAEQLLNEGKKKSEFDMIRKNYDFYEPIIENSIKVNIVSIFEKYVDVQLELLDIADENYDAIYSKLQSDSTIVSTSLNENSSPAKNEPSDNIDYVALNNEIAAITSGGTVIPNLSASEHQSYKRAHGHGSGGTVPRNTAILKEHDGFIAESKVYNTLLKKIGSSGSVEWISGNGVRAGQTKEKDGDDSCGYDIRYTDAEGKLHYVEVKGTSSGNLEFILTKNEFNFAQQHKEQYELWFVFIEDGKAGEPYELGTIFVFDDNEDFFHNHRFTVEQTDFKLRAKMN